MPRADKATYLQTPKGGVRYDLLAQELPDGTLQDALNFMARNGRYVVRPGYSPLPNYTLGLPEGGIYFEDQSDSGIIVVGAQSKWAAFKQSSGGWTDITGTPPTGDYDNLWRLVTFPQGNTILVLGTNNKDTLKSWDISAGAYTDIGGGAPTAALDIDICLERVIAGNVVVGGVRYPSGIVVSDLNNSGSWTVLLTLLTDTPDGIVGIRALNRTAFAIYKGDSEWIGVAQPSGLAPFAYSLVDVQPGPVSKMAIVSVQGGHYYLGKDGSVYFFDGISSRNIGKPIQQHVLDTIHWTYKKRTHGIHRRQDNQIWWFYVDKNANSPYVPQSGIFYNMLTGEFGTLSFGTGILSSWEGDDIGGVLWNQLNGGWNQQVGSWASMGGTDQPIEYLGDNSNGNIQKLGGSPIDNGVSIPFHFTERYLTPYGGGFLTEVDNLEIFTSIAAIVQALIYFGTSEDLSGDPNFQAAIAFDPSVVGRKQIFPLSEIETHFLCFKLVGLLTSGIFSYNGAMLYSNKKSIT